MSIAVLGLGKTGIALAKYFKSQGESVLGLDDGPQVKPEFEMIREYTSRLCLDGEMPDFSQVTRFFISPGVPLHHPIAQQAVKAGLTLENELDLAFSICKGPVVAITGTNGKSTTTSLIGEMFKKAGVAVGVGGNLGTPFLDLVTSGEFTHYVVEVSSFQLETIREFHPHVAIFLNLTDDHFDRHKDMQDYLQAKKMIFACQGPEDYAVYNDDDLYVLESVEDIRSKKIPFSTVKKVEGAFAEIDKIHWVHGGVEVTWSLKNCQLRGLHNLENMTAAVAAAKLMHLSDEEIQQALESFPGLPHRIEWVAKINDVDYFDDSKATNVGAVVMSLASWDEEVVLILGGRDKGGSFSPLKPMIKAKCRALILLGEAKAKIAAELAGTTEIYEVMDMQEAVMKAHEVARPGGVVLLSPGCASFDMFKSYHERGEEFKKFTLTFTNPKK